MSIQSAETCTNQLLPTQEIPGTEGRSEIINLIGQAGYRRILKTVPGLDSLLKNSTVQFIAWDVSPEGYPEGTLIFSLTIDDGSSSKTLLVRVNPEDIVDYAELSED
jgi:hypothetical protein